MAHIGRFPNRMYINQGAPKVQKVFHLSWRWWLHVQYLSLYYPAERREIKYRQSSLHSYPEHNISTSAAFIYNGGFDIARQINLFQSGLYHANIL